MPDRKYTPLVATMADQIAHTGTAHIVGSMPADWLVANKAARQIAADAIEAVIEDVEYCGETTISLARLKRLYEHLRTEGVDRG